MASESHLEKLAADPVGAPKPDSSVKVALEIDSFSTREPAIDVASLNAVESLFRGGPVDPWGAHLAGVLGDLFIYSDHIRYMQPVGADHVRNQRPGAPHPIVEALTRRDGNVFRAETYATEPALRIDAEVINGSFNRFSAWVRNNRSKVSAWLGVQRQDWMRTMKRSAGRHVFDIQHLESDPRILGLAELCKETPHAIVHVLDLNLRIPFYVQSIGDDAVLSNHPVRNSFCLPSTTVEPVRMRKPAVRFGKAVADVARQGNRDDFAILLHELRGIAAREQLIQLLPGEVERERLRDIAASVRLRPQLARGIQSVLEKTVGLVPLVGAFITVLPIGWGTDLPRWAASPGLRWLHPFLEWDLEKQAGLRDTDLD